MLPVMELMSNKEKDKLIKDAIKYYRGNIGELETAIGVLFLAEHIGWKPLYLMNSKASLRKYEKILSGDPSRDVRFRFKDSFPEEGELSHKSVAWEVVKKLKSFWKAVDGRDPGKRSSKIQ